MSAFTTRADIMQKLASGLGYTTAFQVTSGATSTTAAAAASGFFTTRLLLNTLGSTIPTTLQGVPIPPSPPASLHVLGAMLSSSVAWAAWLCRLYVIGTVDLTATGDKLTHDAATFPVLRTQFGVASSPVSLLPVFYLTTATTIVAPVFRLRTAAGASGYTNQAGGSIVGSRTMTLPNVSTTINSAFVMRLEQGDSGVQDITKVEVTTAGTTGAGTMFGVELLVPISGGVTGSTWQSNVFTNGLHMADLAPAVATSGTVTSYLGVISFASTSNADTTHCYLTSVMNA